MVASLGSWQRHWFNILNSGGSRLMMGLGSWWADGSCVGHFFFFFFCYVVSGFCDQRWARMMVTGLEGVTGFSNEKLMWIKRVYTDWDWLGLVQDLMR